MCHVLIIEDEPMIAMLLQDLLEEAGATSFAFAATEQDAVDLAHQQRPSAITSDFRLLQGSGWRAVKRITDSMGAIPVVFITADLDARDRCGALGTILVKPFNSSDAIVAFQNVLAS